MSKSISVSSLGFKPLCLPEGERTVNGVYIGDLLSWVMGRAQADNAWVTIMSNSNVLAVASLTDVACVILADGVTLDSETLKKAQEKNINVLLSDKPIYETVLELNEKLK